MLSARGCGSALSVRLHPSYACVWLYRVSRYLYLGNHTVGARVLAHVNMLVTGADISPAADLGAGLVVVTPPGTAIFGKAGRDLTVMPCAGLGGEIGRREDVGGGPGLPVLGDEVVLGPHSGVLGPCRVGDRVRIDGFVLVAHRDVPDDTIVDGPPARFRTRAGS